MVDKENRQQISEEHWLSGHVRNRAREIISERRELTAEDEQKIQAIKFVGSFSEYFSLVEEMYSIQIPARVKMRIRVMNILTAGSFNTFQKDGQDIPVICSRTYENIDHELRHFVEFMIEGKDREKAFREGEWLMKISSYAFFEMVAVGCIIFFAATKVLIDGLITHDLEHSRMSAEEGELLLMASLLASTAFLFSMIAYRHLPHERRANGIIYE